MSGGAGLIMTCVHETAAPRAAYPIACDRRSVTDREDHADGDHAGRGERISRLDAEDENAKTFNGVHAEPAFDVECELRCRGGGDEVTAVSVAAKSIIITIMQGGRAALPTARSAGFCETFFAAPRDNSLN
jgi:hypothetical protein